VPSLTDYIETRTLQQLQDRFVAVAQAPICICGPDGDPFTKESPLRRRGRQGMESYEANVDIAGDVVAKLVMLAEPVAMDQPSDLRARWRQDILKLMAGVIGGMYDRQRQLRTRAEQLATLYTLTGEFAGQRDLQNLLDMVVQTVVKSLKAKACSIRLFNEERTELVIKAVANLSKTYLDKGPILLSESMIDQEVVATGKPVYIADERSDPRVLYPAEARREGIVSALCAPMMHKSKPEGVLRVYMSRKHQFDWFEASLLSAIAAQAAAAIVNTRLNAEALRAARMDYALATAAEVQRQMIPAKPPQYRRLQIGTVYEPCYELGGDFYDFIELPDDNLGVVICDVAGKGVRASLLMAAIRASLRAHASSVYEMSRVLQNVNRDLCRDSQVGDFATLFYGVIDMTRKVLTYVSAGHLPPWLFRGDQVRRLSTRGAVLGVDSNNQWRHDAIGLQSGDVIVAYTDGLPDAMNFADEPFGEQRVRAAALAAIAAGQSADGIVKHVLWEMRRFAGLQNRGDDLTIVSIRVL